MLYFCRSFEMMRLFIYLMMSVLVHLLAGCEDKGVTAALADVNGLIANGRSDSALILLDSLGEWRAAIRPAFAHAVPPLSSECLQ